MLGVQFLNILNHHQDISIVIAPQGSNSGVSKIVLVCAFLLVQLLILWLEYTLAYGYNIFYHARILPRPSVRLCTDSSLCAEFWVFAGCDFLKCACTIMVSIAQGLCKLCNI